MSGTTMAAATLLVLPNPYTHLDHNGRPAGLVAVDPHEHNPTPGLKVGAKIASAELIRKAEVRVIAGRQTTVQPADYDIVWEFTSEPVRLPNTAYYRERIREGELVCADEATARLCGRRYETPEAVLYAAKTASGLADAPPPSAPKNTESPRSKG